MLISLRMIYTPCCSFPITLDNIENGDIFSVYEWIAHDELRITHRQDDLISLERICESIKDNDTNGKWKAMQQACMEESSKLSPLLYFLRHREEKDKRLMDGWRRCGQTVRTGTPTLRSE